MWNRLSLCPPFQQFLNFLKVLIADDGRVGMFYISKTMVESYYQDHQGTKDKASNTTN